MSEENAVALSTEDDDFDAGFTGTDTPTTTPEAEVKVETPAADEDKAFDVDDAPTPAADPEPATDPEPEPKYVQLTEEELNSLKAKAGEVDLIKEELHKKVSGAFGKIGGLEQIVRNLQQSTAAGQPLQLTDEDFAEISEEYGDLGGKLKNLLTKIKGTGAPAAIDPSFIEETKSTAVTLAKAEIAQETLDETHPDWRQVIGLPTEQGIPQTEFRQWLATQPAEYQARVNTAYNPVTIGRAIDSFKAAKQAKEEAEKASALSRKRRLEAAVTPRGTGGAAPSAPTEDDAFEQGFNSG